jgi:hypothetical protein
MLKPGRLSKARQTAIPTAARNEIQTWDVDPTQG